MPESEKPDFDPVVPVDEEEDEETLSAIDEGVRDANAGRVVPAEGVRELLRKWSTT